ncbi:Mast cell carboxypeptidase A [Seminavis robusta]|uniref:Mast cell carboxypeptidase A n=1 Tax=Seminavis robusta TaxID=568900 RepID=A0A9N8EAC2_9STRA|nr:Mast cell carboxypeptidase A [Seminavis robusta]|eukprot:Sro857_g211650.1 Mast cell carboxypeptidase A (632) ;mRNA; r:2522-4617
MKFFGCTLACLLVLNGACKVSAGGIRPALSVHDTSLYPQIFSVVTSRDVASTYGSSWDIQHAGSRRLREEDDNLVQLGVVVHNEIEAAHFEHLETSGVLSYEAVENEGNAQRLLQGINQELSCYRTVQETFDAVDELAAQYSDFVRVETIGESWRKQNGDGGFDIKIMVLSAPTSDPAVNKVDMMVVAGHHSRELPPPEAVMKWATLLLEGFGKDADLTWILERTNIHIVPIANPDGRQIVQENLDWMYRKNAHPFGCENGTALEGVDLNRQYPMMWGNDTGSSGDPCSTAFRGPAPLSEPESNAVFTYASQLFADDMKKGSIEEAEAKVDEACPEDATGIFIDVHSYGDFVYFPFGFEDRMAPNHRSLLTMSSKLAHPGNYSLWGPGQDGFLYFVSGDATDATYGINCVASFGFEIGSQFYADCFELESSIAPKLHESLLYAAKSAISPYTIPLGPDVLTISVDTTTASSAQLTVAVSDAALIVDHAKFDGNLSQAIAQVRVFVDEHPYDNDGVEGLLMDAQDGSFDEEDEVATYSLDTSELMVGRHVLYFQATDSEGYAGPVAAVFLDVDDYASSNVGSPLGVSKIGLGDDFAADGLAFVQASSSPSMNCGLLMVCATAIAGAIASLMV